MFYVEERVWWWWEIRGFAFLTLDAALDHLQEISNAPPPAENKVVYEKH
jgi:hypothetical protein